MPRRSSARTLYSDVATLHASSPALAPTALPSSDLLELRRQWKWAAFSQFFFTFAALFNMSDVSIVDIENDLTCSTSIVLPRVMQRLLYTVSQDRKVNLENWQTSLRKQYTKRDPEASPLGPEPSRTPPPESSPGPEALDDSKAKEIQNAGDDTPMVSTTHPTPAPEESKIEHTETVKEASELPVQTEEFQSVKDECGSQPDAAPVEDASPEPTKEDSVPKEESKDWFELPMLVKLESMHLLTEWQFQNPTRLRTIMKSDDEYASWRIEPIGYDAKSNAYWLIGADRLWIQRTPPKPPQNRKRKRPANGDNHSRKTKRPAKELVETFEAPVTPSASRAGGRSGRRNAPQPVPTTSGGRGGGRAAKAQAKEKMDAQAKELAEFQRQAAVAARNKGKAAAPPPPPPKGTRLSKRLRGAIEEEEWQPVPDEWLAESSSPAPAKASKMSPKTGLESDDESALTSLSGDDGEEGKAEDPISDETKLNSQRLKDDGLDDRGLEVPPEMPSGFIEWETIAVTLYEWEHVAQPFEKATHYTEKALYKTLMVEIVPVITAELKEIERKRQIDEALVHRKRSSRIAIKESEKEEAELAAKKRAEEEEKMSRVRRLEARQQKEATEREKKESAREQRRKEREQRELQAQQAPATSRNASADPHVDVISDHPSAKRTHPNGVHPRKSGHVNGSASGSGSGTRTPAGEEWELDCEICYRRGINQDDGQPMMSCGACSKWQHISCHDSADILAGRPKRNWDIEEFICQRCKTQGARKLQNVYHPQVGQYTEQNIARTHTLLPQSANRITYIQPTANPAPSRMNPAYGGVQPYSSSIPNRQQGHDNSRTTTQTTMAQQPYLPHSAITFAHYQPDPQGFSTRQTYHRDIPNQGQAFAGPPPQQQHIANTVISSTAQTSPPQSQPYGNGGWGAAPHQQSYPAYTGNLGFSDGQSRRQEQYSGPPQWQAPRQSADPRAPVPNFYAQFQHNPATGPTPYQMPH